MDTIKLLEKLITFRTTENRVNQIREAVGYVEKLFKDKKVWTRTHYVGDKPVLYACTTGTRKPDLLLVPHLDVVEGADSQFVPKRRGAWLYGRGATDCKSNAAVTIQTLLHFAGSGKSVGAYLTTDEEIGGPTTRFLVKRGYVGKLNVLLDNGRAVVYRQKGILNLQVSVRGKSAHGARPWNGINANEKLMRAYPKIKKLFPPTRSKNRWHPTVNLGIMQGGDTINRVPDTAHMWLNIRLTEKVDYRRVIEKIRAIPEVDRIKMLGHYPFYACDPKSLEVKNFKKAMEQELGAKLKLESMHGATDAHNFAGVKEPVVISGVGAGKGEHGPKECVDTREVRRFESALQGYIEKSL